MISEKYDSTFHVLLTGGTGFFGRALLRNWVSFYQSGEKIAKVCVLSRNPEAFLNKFPEFSQIPWLCFCQGDIMSPSTIPRENFTHILHAATESTIGPQLSPLDRYMQIVDGTKNMLDFAVENGIMRFLLTSSGGVYGKQPETMHDILESYLGFPDPTQPENAYSIAKRGAEHLCFLYRKKYNIQIILARCFTFIGRDLPLDAHFAVGNFINDAINSKEIKIKGDGLPIRTYMDQRDLAEWLTKILYEGVDGEIYNVGSDEKISIVELAKIIRDAISPDKPIKIEKNEQIIKLHNNYVPNIEKARNTLGLKIKYNIYQSIEEMARSSKKIKI